MHKGLDMRKVILSQAKS